MLNEEEITLLKEIEEKGVFDKIFYLKEYQDVRISDITPIEHYVKYGIKENRKPNINFNPISNEEKEKDIKTIEIDPINYYLEDTFNENSLINPSQLETEIPTEIETEILSDEIILKLNNPIDKKTSSETNSEPENVNILFDADYYRITYQDISVNNIDPLSHFVEYGWKEGRKPNAWFDTQFYIEKYIDVKQSELNPLDHYLNIGMKENRRTLQNFDFDFYVSYYEDLKDIFDSYYAAVQHYIKYGILENRLINVSSLLELRGYSSLEIKKIEEYLHIDLFTNLQKINKVQLSYMDFVDNITALSFKPIKIHTDEKINAKFYVALAEIYLIKNNYHIADRYLNLSLHFYKNRQALEYKGNINLNMNNYLSASNYYENSFIQGKHSIYLYDNLHQCYQKLYEHKKAINILLRAEKDIPLQSNRFIEKLNHEINSYYSTYKIEAFNTLLITSDREKLIEDMNILTRDIYNFYFKLYNGEAKVESYNTINSDKILIIGDYHIEQCVRYRIDQKVEQLEFQGYDVKTVNWTQLKEYEDIIPFYDIVIFYRVPSTVEILKTLAKVNALNKISIFEIDDLLFEAIYPDSIESYGGNLDLDQYNSLIFGMSKFNSVAKLCNYTLASTIPLKEKLEDLVSKNSGILHRNGLDSLIRFEKVNKENKKTIDIFYGSGTLAHNQDFIDLVLPALEKLMNEFVNVRVIIAGHLILPEQTIVEFKKRIIFLPKVKVKAYYNYLKQADINLAVLYKDEITNAKSELKWFEAGCFFVPSVVSNTQNYLDVIKEAEDGFIAANSEEWYIKLRSLVVDKELRVKIGENVAKRIKNEYSIKTLGQELKENLNTLIESNYPQNKKKKKKIALVNVFFPPQSIGGATRVVADNFDVLIDKYSDEYEICVFTSEVECLEPYKMTMYNYKGARVYKANILYREHMDWHPEDKNMYKLFGEFLDTEAPDKVHFHCVQRLSASIVEATRDAKIPYIITAHDAWWISDHQFLVDKNNKVYPDGHVDPYYDKVLYENMTLDMSIERNSYLKSLLIDAQHVLTVSESFAKIYRKNGVPNIAVTKNGISSKIEWLEKETSYSSKVVCGHIGGMSAHKGYDILKKAVMKTQPKNLEFLVVDHSKEESYISNEKWGEVDVKFIGRQNQDEMLRIYTKLDVLFAPSIWPESFGLVTREASACRCWIVASNLGGIGEDVIDGKNGFVINPKQKAIEKTLKKLDNNYKEYKELAPKANISMVEEQVETLKEYLND